MADTPPEDRQYLPRCHVMTIPQKHMPFKLRARIHDRRNMSDEAAMIVALTDRIANLRGIETVERWDDNIPRHIDVYLKRDLAARVCETQPPPLLYSLNCNGVMVSGLDRWARHEVVSRSWGKPIFDQVLIFLPRSKKELDVVWKILQRAYNNLSVSSANNPELHVVSTWDLPKSSRRTLRCSM